MFDKANQFVKNFPAKKSQDVNFALEPFVVNLMDHCGTKYLKVTIQLEISDTKLTEKVKKNKTPQIRDAIIAILTNKISDELITSEGKLFLKDEIKQNMNLIFDENTVKNVYFTEFIIQ